MPRVTIDTHEFDAPDGLNVIQAARQIGIKIPHFCFHPGLGTDGNCRLCLIEVEGIGKPQIACNTFVKDGLTVRTDTEKIGELRKAILEFFFLNHPLDCPICDQAGECLLQDFYMQHGQYESRLDLPKHHKRKVIDVGPRVVLDAERCVLCRRCVRFCDQIAGTGELRVISRGAHSEIGVFPDHPLENRYSLNPVALCPVGALTSRDFRFKCRVWFLQTAKSICTGCSRGCNIYLEHKDGTVHRYRPRENPEVNQWWMCDDGRLTYRRLNEGRCATPTLDGREVPSALAVERIAEALRSAGEQGGTDSILMILSADMSNESLYAAVKFAREVLGGTRIVAGSRKPPAYEDEILMKADPHPNRKGAQILSLWTEDLAAALREGGRLALIIQNDMVDHDPSIAALLEKFETVICLATETTETTARAGIVHPVTPHSEYDGTFTNFQGRVQRFRRAMPPRGDAMTVTELLRRISARMGTDLGLAGLNATWQEMGATIAEFEGINPGSLGDGGLLIRSGHEAAGTSAEKD